MKKYFCFFRSICLTNKQQVQWRTVCDNSDNNSIPNIYKYFYYYLKASQKKLEYFVKSSWNIFRFRLRINIFVFVHINWWKKINSFFPLLNSPETVTTQYIKFNMYFRLVHSFTIHFHTKSCLFLMFFSSSSSSSKIHSILIWCVFWCFFCQSFRCD